MCSPVREAPRSSLFVEHVSRRWKNAFLLSAAMSLREPPESSGTEKVKYDLLVRIPIGCAVHILLLTDFKDYEVDHEVGRGGSSVVYSARCKSGRLRGRIFAVKQVRIHTILLYSLALCSDV